MNEDIALFLTSVAAEVRRMPVAEARQYLRGLLSLVGMHPDMDCLREVYRHLDLGDAQLELIAGGQMKLPLGGNGR